MPESPSEPPLPSTFSKNSSCTKSRREDNRKWQKTVNFDGRTRKVATDTRKQQKIDCDRSEELRPRRAVGVLKIRMKKRDSVVSEPIKSPLAEGPDSVLIAASNCARGGAFDVLVERYRATFFSVAFQITRNPEDAEDLVQQSFQKAFLQLPSFEAKSSFATWL